MNCYACETDVKPGGMRFAIRTASAVCASCGVGFCQDHRAKKNKHHSEIFCLTCSNKGDNDE